MRGIRWLTRCAWERRDSAPFQATKSPKPFSRKQLVAMHQSCTTWRRSAIVSYQSSQHPANHLQVQKEPGHVHTGGTVHHAPISCRHVTEACTPVKGYTSQTSGVATPFTGFSDLMSLPKLSPDGTLDQVSYLSVLPFGALLYFASLMYAVTCRVGCYGPQTGFAAAAPSLHATLPPSS